MPCETAVELLKRPLSHWGVATRPHSGPGPCQHSWILASMAWAAIGAIALQDLWPRYARQPGEPCRVHRLFCSPGGIYYVDYPAVISRLCGHHLPCLRIFRQWHRVDRPPLQTLPKRHRFPAGGTGYGAARVYRHPDRSADGQHNRPAGDRHRCRPWRAAGVGHHRLCSGRPHPAALHEPYRTGHRRRGAARDWPGSALVSFWWPLYWV